MTLKNITLPATVMASLYKHALADIRDYLGGNQKNILLLVNYSSSRFMPLEDLTFLAGILKACKLSIDDIAVVNLDNEYTRHYKPVSWFLKSQIIIYSGTDFSSLELPFKIPLFQAQLYEDKKYVHIPPLTVVQKDLDLKRKLWELLKVLF